MRALPAVRWMGSGDRGRGSGRVVAGRDDPLPALAVAWKRRSPRCRLGNPPCNITSWSTHSESARGERVSICLVGFIPLCPPLAPARPPPAGQPADRRACWIHAPQTPRVCDGVARAPGQEAQQSAQRPHRRLRHCRRRLDVRIPSLGGRLFFTLRRSLTGGFLDGLLLRCVARCSDLPRHGSSALRRSRLPPALPRGRVGAGAGG